MTNRQFVPLHAPKKYCSTTVRFTLTTEKSTFPESSNLIVMLLFQPLSNDSGTDESEDEELAQITSATGEELLLIFCSLSSNLLPEISQSSSNTEYSFNPLLE